MTLTQIKLAGYFILALGIVGGVLYIKHQFALRDKFEASAKFERAEKDKAIATINEQIENAKKDKAITTELHDEQTKIEYVERVVTKEIIKYRDANPVRCQLNDNWVRIYNQAITTDYLPSSAIGANDKTIAP